jgi:hypothetical protein
MTVDQAGIAWEAMLVDANDSPRPATRRRSLGRHVMVALRTTALLILAALAILVLLPAALVAQAAFAG